MTIIMPLTAEEKKAIITLIRSDQPLPRKYLQHLFPLSEHGEFLWSGKFSPYKNNTQLPIDSIVSPWKNLLFHGDNLTALTQLLAHKASLGAAGGIKLLYIDPPFAVGTDFHMSNPAHTTKTIKKPASHPKILAYSDRWKTMSEYYSMLYQRLALMHKVLHDNGCLCLHCDWRTSHTARVMLDEIFGEHRFLNEIIWHYTGGGRAQRYFSRKHDTLLLYSKSTTWTFSLDAIRVPYKKSSGYAKAGIVSKAGKHYLPNPKGTPVDDVWEIPIINPMAKERVGYATQKPLALLTRLIAALTEPDDIVADFFCGSGTTLVAANSLKRRWIACDKGEQAIATVTTRLTNDKINNQKGGYPYFLQRL